ncbi:MAG: zinc transporter ZupT [Clostridiales bacterium]|nr:zinc transporter ZupT [Clostridiales bacterium]
MNNTLIAFLLTLLAGLSTGIGSLIAFFAKKTNTKFLSVSLGLSAGVMIYVSMVEIFPEAHSSLSRHFNSKTAMIITVVAFFAGMILIGLIDSFIPSDQNPHEAKSVEDMDADNIAKNKLMRTGVYTALAVGIHNFPEGLATFVSALKDPKLAIPIVVAIAIHNIPEGIAVSVPIYYATDSRKKALIYSFTSGLSEPIGAIIGYALLMPIMNEVVFGILFASVAGIMVFISLDELLPAAQEYGEHHSAIYGLIAGMAIMAFSLILFM